MLCFQTAELNLAHGQLAIRPIMGALCLCGSAPLTNACWSFWRNMVCAYGQISTLVDYATYFCTHSLSRTDRISGASEHCTCIGISGHLAEMMRVQTERTRQDSHPDVSDTYALKYGRQTTHERREATAIDAFRASAMHAFACSMNICIRSCPQRNSVYTSFY